MLQQQKEQEFPGTEFWGKLNTNPNKKEEKNGHYMYTGGNRSRVQSLSFLLFSTGWWSERPKVEEKRRESSKPANQG